MLQSTMIKWGARAAAVALVTSTIAIDSVPARANPSTPLYSGGGTLAELVYRDVFNCYGSNSGANPPSLGTPPSSAAAPAFNCTAGGFPINPDVEALYSGVGSGNGKKAFIAHDASKLTSGGRVPDSLPQGSSGDFGPFFGATAGVQSFPGLNDPYPTFTFAGSDDPLTPSDVTTYNAHLSDWGPPIQIPTLVTAVAIGFQPTATWNPKGKQPKGGSSKVQLSRNTWCGIFTGAITNWNDPEIAADNKAKATDPATQLGDGQITVVVRGDGSGTTFLFSNALVNQCGTDSHPASPPSTHPVPDSWIADNGGALAGNNNFFISVNAAGHLHVRSASSVFSLQPGNGGIQKFLDNPANPGAVAYISPGFVQPIATGNDSNGNPVQAAANVQTWATVVSGAAPKWAAPTAKASTQIMAKAKAPKFSCSPKPCTPPANVALNWGATDPLPLSNSAYPIGGFTFLDAYTCYASASNVAALVGTGATPGLLTWYYGSAAVNNNIPTDVLGIDGFAPLPGSWKAAVNKLLLTNASTKIRQAPSAGVCTGSGA